MAVGQGFEPWKGLPPCWFSSLTQPTLAHLVVALPNPYVPYESMSYRSFAFGVSCRNMPHIAKHALKSTLLGAGDMAILTKTYIDKVQAPATSYEIHWDDRRGTGCVPPLRARECSWLRGASEARRSASRLAHTGSSPNTRGARRRGASFRICARVSTRARREEGRRSCQGDAVPGRRRFLINYAGRQYKKHDSTPLILHNPVGALKDDWIELQPHTSDIDEKKVGGVWHILTQARANAYNRDTCQASTL